jgi:hypothetical protein
MICRCACVCQTEVAVPPTLRPPPRDQGGPRCASCELANHFDVAKRASDEIRLHLLADKDRAIESWIAIRLSDGGSDGVLYPFKHIAVRHQLHEQQCAYIKIPIGGVSPREAEVFLRFNRMLYDNGFRVADPDKDIEVIMPLGTEHHG